MFVGRAPRTLARVSQELNTILWATDGRPDDDQIADYIGELCEDYACRLRIVHVVPASQPEPMPAGERHEHEERVIAWLKARTRAFRRQGVDASLHVTRGVVGSPVAAITEIAGAVDADMIVLHPDRRRPIGSTGTAARLMASTAYPVLLLGREIARCPARRTIVSGSAPAHPTHSDRDKH